MSSIPSPALNDWVPMWNLGGNIPATQPYVRVGLVGTQSIPNATYTAISFDTVRGDRGPSPHWVSGSPTRLTCQVAGVYIIAWAVQFPASATGNTRLASARLNGATQLAYGGQMGLTWLAAAGGMGTDATLYYLNVGDYIELMIYHDIGSAQNITSNQFYSPELMMALVGGMQGPPGSGILDQALPPSGNNANNAIAAGFYRLDSGATNAPPITAYYHLHVMNMYGNQLRQIAYQIGTENVFIRRYDTNAWTPWQQQQFTYDAAWVTSPTLQNGWTHYGAPYGPGRYRKTGDGLVVCDGLILAGTVTSGTVVMTFPAGYRPASNRQPIFTTACTTSIAETLRLDGSNGNLTLSAGHSAGSWISLTGVTFYAEA